jgi:hypothetical protein
MSRRRWSCSWEPACSAVRSWSSGESPWGSSRNASWQSACGRPRPRYPDRTSWRPFYQEVLRRVQALPGVDAAATVSVRPLSGPGGWDFPFTAEGQTDAEAGGNPMANLQAVSADYFRTMGIVVKRGRVFTDGDVEGQPGVVVVTEALAEHAWPGQDPIGKRLRIPQLDTPYHRAWLAVVGVVGAVRYRELQATRGGRGAGHRVEPRQGQGAPDGRRHDGRRVGSARRATVRHHHLRGVRVGRTRPVGAGRASLRRGPSRPAGRPAADGDWNRVRSRGRRRGFSRTCSTG